MSTTIKDQYFINQQYDALYQKYEKEGTALVKELGLLVKLLEQYKSLPRASIKEIFKFKVEIIKKQVKQSKLDHIALVAIFHKGVTVQATERFRDLNRANDIGYKVESLFWWGDSQPEKQGLRDGRCVLGLYSDKPVKFGDIDAV